MRYDAIIFDLDGTLLDTLDDLHDSVNAALGDMGFPLRTREEVRSFVGEGYTLLMTRALPYGTQRETIDRAAELFRGIYFSNLRKRTRPYEGIPELLKTLKDRGIRTGVVSNKLDEAVKESCRHFFGTAIDYALGDNPLGRRKPEPDNVFAVMKLLGAEPDRTLYVGDSDVDARTAKKAGLPMVGVDWGFRSRETLIKAGTGHVISRPEELLHYLEDSFHR